MEFQLREQELQSDLSAARSEHEGYLNQLRALTRVQKTETLMLVGSKQQRSGSQPQGSALVTNVERRILESEKEVLAAKRSQISGTYKPSVSVFADVGKITPEPLDSKARLESVVGLNVSVPLYDGGQRSSREQIAAIEMAKVNDQMEKVEVQLQTTLNSVEIEEQNLRDAEVINQKRLESAEKYLRSTMDEYKRGVKNSPDALNSTERLFAAKLRKIDLTLQRDLLDVKKFSIIGQSQ